MLGSDIDKAERLISEGEIEAAAGVIRPVLSRNFGDTMALLLAADVEMGRERNDSARGFVGKALSSNLDGPRTALKLLQVLARLSESGLMIEIGRQIPPQQWDSAMSLSRVSQLLMSVGAFDAALVFAQAAVARDGKYQPGLYSLATLKTFFGEHQEAADLCRRCLALLPNDPSSYWLLSRLRQPGAGERIDQLKPLLASAVSSEDRAWLAYALHNELHDQGEIEASWSALSTACDAKRSKALPLIEKQNEIFDALRAADDWGSDRLGHASTELRAIFVIGLHRSGTTLAEQILAGHSKVASGGETYDLRAQLRRVSTLHFRHELDTRVIGRRHDLDYAALGQHYLRGMTWRAAGKPYVTDKLPSNYFNVGFIARALPESRFIHLVRDPIDVGFSSLRTLFSHAAPYSYAQDDFTAHHRRYLELMTSWHARLPGRIMDVRYDDLVREPETMARRIAEFVGLDFEPGMIQLETRTGAVATASSVMMRDGIRKDRGKIWKPYERHLAPLINAFT
ncbi:MAG: tetratricopeptide repeat-containing sulfotransferase family protein [Steroidobacteraceae bacterium]